MEHLTLEEIAAYVALEKKDDESMVLASRVYSHLAECEKCRCAVGSMLDLSTVLKKRSRRGSKKKVSEEKKQAKDI